MEDIYTGPQAYRPIMAGLFAGIIATLLNIIYDVIFRDSTGYSLPELINVSTIIFGTLLILVVAGSFYAIIERFTSSPIIYIVVTGLSTLFCLRSAMNTVRTDNPVLNHEFHLLLSAIVIITGTLATFFVPLLVKKGSSII